MSRPDPNLFSLIGLTDDSRTLIFLEEPAEADPHELWDRLATGTYRKPILIDDGRRRSLYFSIEGNVQSEMSLEDPVKLVSDYTRKMMGFLLFCPRPRHVVMLGLGGGCLAKFCHRHLPQTMVTAVEINPAVVELREHFDVPPDDARFRVVQGDGAEYVASLAESGDIVDAILVDAYDRRGIARSVSDPSFLQNCRRVLSPDGVFVMNLALRDSRRDTYLRMIRSAFGGPVIAASVNWDGNTVAFAGPALGNRRRLRAAPHYARWAKARLDLQFTQLPGLARQCLELNFAHTSQGMTP